MKDKKAKGKRLKDKGKMNQTTGVKQKNARLKLKSTENLDLKPEA